MPDHGARFWKQELATNNRTPAELQKACMEYFDWATDNPLQEAKPFAFQGNSWIEELDKARVFTIQGLATFLGMTTRGLTDLLKDEAFIQVGEWIDQVIYQQKFELAAADLLNAGLIARDLKLADKTETDTRTVVMIQGDDSGL